MNIKGHAMLARKMIVTRRFGSEAWNQLFANMAAGHPCFRSPLTDTSLVPLGDFLAFHDEMIRRLFDGDETRYFELGKQSALWALNEGPYKGLVANRDLAQLVTALPRLWQEYFAETTSRSEVKVIEGTVELEVFDLPDWHPYFEYLIAGWHQAALNLLYVNPVEAQQVRGGRGREYKYVFRPGVGAGSSARQARTALSSRETDVLRLIADGKTNKEIGALLAISDRTVQVHASRIYAKVGVLNRTGAALWLAEQRQVSQ